jgi:hypothetical protein
MIWIQEERLPLRETVHPDYSLPLNNSTTLSSIRSIWERGRPPHFDFEVLMIKLFASKLKLPFSKESRAA